LVTFSSKFLADRRVTTLATLRFFFAEELLNGASFAALKIGKLSFIAQATHDPSLHLDATSQKTPLSLSKPIVDLTEVMRETLSVLPAASGAGAALGRPLAKSDEYLLARGA